MTALSDNRFLNREVWKDRTFTAKSGELIYKGATVAIQRGTGYVVEATGASNEIVIGIAMEKVDATSAAASIAVDLIRSFEVVYFSNYGTIASTDIGEIGYVKDDNSVSLTPTSTGGSVLGRVWAVDSVRGVAVEVDPDLRNGELLLEQTALSWTANDVAIASNPPTGAVYDIPTTTGASTVSLPATAREGTVLTFVADGTKNGHTVTYRDVTTAISAALTASKRHQARCVYLNGGWTIITTVSP